MPIPYSALPPRKSVYDYPALVPGVPPTEEQEEQMTLAEIAGIVLAVATAKEALKNAVTSQIVGLLRATDLLNEAAVAAFAASAAALVRAALDESRSITWGGITRRAEILDIPFSEPTPDYRELPNELRYSRNTPLETAYARLANEYKKWVERDVSDPIIEELVEQFESANVTPLPRPEMISSDVEQRESETNVEQEWQRVFRQAQKEQREASRRANAEISRRTEEQEARRAEAEERAAARRSARLAEQERRRAEAESRSDSGTQANSASSPSITVRLEDGERDELEQTVLSPNEVSVVIEQHAQQKTEELAERMVEMDIQLASRNAQAYAMQRMPKDKVTGYRRVIHPELAKSGMSCGLCIIASTMKYTKGDLLPIHSGCNCETVEIFRRGNTIYDPGQQINEEDLRVFYEEAGNSTHGWDLKKQRYRVVDHPEYGPTLVNDKKDRRKEAVNYSDRMGLEIE